MPTTNWIRLTPVSRDPEMQSALEARVHDPLWMLARQWQLGEFRGEDAGSPTLAEVWASTAPIVRWTPAPGSGMSSSVVSSYDVRTAPFEAVVERERVRFDEAAGVALAAEAGLHFLRLLEAKRMAKYQRDFTNAYPLRPPVQTSGVPIDAATAGFLAVMMNRTPDGGALYAAFRGARPSATTGGLPSNPSVAAGDVPAVLAVVDDWLAWYEGALFDEPSLALPDAAAWRRDRMEYEIDAETSVLGSGQGAVVLNAPEYTGGELDWFTFDVRSAPTPANQGPRPPTLRMTPAPVTYRGMPAARYWQFEDARVNLSAVKLSTEGEGKDAATLLLLEFALMYGNDWFVVPFELPVGSVTRVDALLVTDTFGERTAIQPIRHAGRGSEADWAMFTLAPRAAAAATPEPVAERPALLLVPPGVVSVLESMAVEEVMFARDEMANLAWAIERVVEGPAGRPVNRYEEAQAKRERASAQSSDSTMASAARLAYRIRTEVPEHWSPLVPLRDSDGAMSLHRGVMDAADPATPRGRVLGGPPFAVREEEVPRGGVRVTRAYRYARAIDGSTHLWVGRRKQPGRGEASSGLQFDKVTRKP